MVLIVRLLTQAISGGCTRDVSTVGVEGLHAPEHIVLHLPDRRKSFFEKVYILVGHLLGPMARRDS